MTPQQKIKWAILAKVTELEEKDAPEYPCSNIDELYDELVEKGEHCDAESELREGEVETSLPCEWSRHYESDAVAMQMPDKSWIGWTYWHGGGKHGNPEEIDWIDDAYDVECTEEEKLVIVRTFSLKDQA